jgi:hypothetical protein
VEDSAGRLFGLYQDGNTNQHFAPALGHYLEHSSVPAPKSSLLYSLEIKPTRIVQNGLQICRTTPVWKEKHLCDF